MSSTDELLRELEEDEDTATRSPASETAASDGRGARLKRRAGSVFSPSAFLAALLFVGGGLLAGSAVPLIPGTGLLGVAFAAFVHGLLADERRYLEIGVAGGIVSALGFVLFNVTTLTIGLFNGWGVQMGLLLAGVGFLAGVVGHYFGRDLRSGLTADLGE
jgi:hypothetical protein